MPRIASLFSGLLLLSLALAPAARGALTASQRADLQEFFSKMNRRHFEPTSKLTPADETNITNQMQAFQHGGAWIYSIAGAGTELGKEVLHSDEGFAAIGSLAASTEVYPFVARSARETLGKIPDPRAFRQLVNIADSKADDDVRTSAVDAIGAQMTAGGLVEAADYLSDLAETGPEGPRKSAAKRHVAIVMSPNFDPALLRSLSKSKSAVIAGRAKQTLGKFKDLDGRLPEEDVKFLEFMKSRAIERLESNIQSHQEGLKAGARAKPVKGAPPPGNRTAEHTAAINASRVEIAAIRKTRPADFGAKRVAEYCELTRKGAQVQALMQQHKNLADLADVLPVIKYTVTPTEYDYQGRPVSGVAREEEFDTAAFAKGANYVVGGFMVEAVEAMHRADQLRQDLVVISPGGMAVLKKMYLEDFAAKAKKEGANRPRGRTSR